MSHNLDAWLGPAADELTGEQTARLERIAAEIDEHYPDPDEQPQRDAALSITVQYLLGETTAEEVSQTLGRARQAEVVASAAAQQYAVMLHADGMGEIPAALSCGITKRTLRRALGKE